MNTSVGARVSKVARNEFGVCLRSLRSKANLNLHGLAQKINSSPAWLSYLERGQRVPAWPLIESCIDAFKCEGIPITELNHFKLLAKGEIMRKIFDKKEVFTNSENSRP